MGAKTEQCAALQRQVDDLQSQVSPAAAPTAAAALVSQGRRRQVKKLTRMKETLADNISSLFKTAAGEIARKDAQNKELSARCARPARLRRQSALSRGRAGSER